MCKLVGRIAEQPILFCLLFYFCASFWLPSFYEYSILVASLFSVELFRNHTIHVLKPIDFDKGKVGLSKPDTINM